MQLFGAGRRLVAKATALILTLAGSSVLSIAQAPASSAACLTTQYKWTSLSSAKYPTGYTGTFYNTTWRSELSGASLSWDNGNIPNSNLNTAAATWTSSLSAYDSAVWNVTWTDILPYGQGTGVPAVTITQRTAGGDVLSSTNYMGTHFTWNTDGIMNQSTRRADVRAVMLHEFGHTHSLMHPQVCSSSLTVDEKAAVMYVDWTLKLTPRTDDKIAIAARY